MPRAAVETNPLTILDDGSFDVADAQRPAAVLHTMPPRAWSLQRIGQRLARRAKLGSGYVQRLADWEMYYQTDGDVREYSDGLTWLQVIARTCAAPRCTAAPHAEALMIKHPSIQRSRLALHANSLRCVDSRRCGGPQGTRCG